MIRSSLIYLLLFSLMLSAPLRHQTFSAEGEGTARLLSLVELEAETKIPITSLDLTIESERTSAFIRAYREILCHSSQSQLLGASRVWHLNRGPPKRSAC